VFSKDNEMAPAKILSDFAKEFEKPRVKAAVVDGRLYDTKAIVKLALLPSREVLLSQLLGTFIAPMTTFLGAVNAMLATPANMADALAREKSKAS
jgi:large subunit ribosomal protein L10